MRRAGCLWLKNAGASNSSDLTSTWAWTSLVWAELSYSQSKLFIPSWIQCCRLDTCGSDVFSREGISKLKPASVRLFTVRLGKSSIRGDERGMAGGNNISGF